MSRLLTYVETPNQCRLTGRIIPALKDLGISVDVVYLPKFPGPTLGTHVRQLGARFVYTPDDNLQGQPTRRELYAQFRVVVGSFARVVSQYPLFLTWNDGTNTTRRLVPVARASGAVAVVVQDGFLDQIPATDSGPIGTLSSTVAGRISEHGLRVPFVSQLLRRRLYPRFNFGSGKADRYFVYGRSMQRKMHALMGTPLQIIEPIGSPDMSQAAMDFVRLGNAELPRRGKLRILFIDQCHVAHGKLSLDDWQRTYPTLIATMARHNLTIKLHPGESPHIRRRVYEHVRDTARIISDGFSQALDWSGFDVVVTATSSAFLDALAARVPVILFRFPGLVEAFPRVQSGVIKCCASLDELRTFLDGLEERRVFIGERTGLHMDSLFAQPSEVAFERRVAAKLAALLERQNLDTVRTGDSRHERTL